MALTAVRKLLAIVAGVDTLIPAAQLGGAANANEVVALNSSGMLDITMMPPGLNVDAQSLPATEAIAAGSLVNVWLSASTPSARNADNTSTGKPAVGFAAAAIASAATGTITFAGIISGLSGLTPGAMYFLGAAGAVVLGTGLPTASGTIIQQIGYALSTTTLQFNPQPQTNQ
jgi:hypothetical protein